MKEESLRMYSRRVTQANRTELILVLFDVILEDMDEAEKKMEEDMVGAAEDIDHAQKFLYELIASLDHRYPIAANLLSLYIYVNRCFIRCGIYGRNTGRKEAAAAELQSAIKVMKALERTFREVRKADDSGPLMEKTQQIYAGLTYGKGTLTEYMVSPDEKNRGYRA